MTVRDIHLFKAFLLFLLIVSLAGLVVYQTHVLTAPVVQATNVADIDATGAPNGTPKAPIQRKKIVSSDRSKALYIRSTKQLDSQTLYELFISDTQGANARVLLTKVLGSTRYLEIPINSWSPEDNYIFVQVIGHGTVDTAIVLTPTGKPFDGGEMYIDIAELWKLKNMEFSFRKVTGWASPTLLILYTSKADGYPGPAYWFEVPTGNFIQLAQ